MCQAEISDIPSEDDTDAAFSERMQKYNDNICAILKPFKDRVENVRLGVYLAIGNNLN